MLGNRVCLLYPSPCVNLIFLFCQIRFFYLLPFNMLKEHFPNYQNYCMHTYICRHAFMCIACICMCMCMYMHVCVYNMFSIHQSCFCLFFSVMDRYEDSHYGCACPSISSITINIILCHVLYVNRKL